MSAWMGQSRLRPNELGSIAVPKQVYHVVGVAPTKIEKPDGANSLVLFVENDNFRMKVGNYAIEDLVVDDAAEDTFTLEEHNYDTGDGPYQVDTDNTLPAGLAGSTDYWIIKVDEDTFKLATSYANAIAGTAVNVTDAGTGSHTIDGTVAIAEAPAGTDNNGNGSVLLSAAALGNPHVYGAPSVLTVVGYDAGSVLTYWWI